MFICVVLFFCCAWVSNAPRNVPSEPSVLPAVSRDRCPFGGVCRSVERRGVALQALRLACPSVPVFSRVSAPGVVALLMLFSTVMVVGSAYSVGAAGECFFASVGQLVQLFITYVLERDVIKHLQHVRARNVRQMGDCLGDLWQFLFGSKGCLSREGF